MPEAEVERQALRTMADLVDEMRSVARAGARFERTLMRALVECPPLDPDNLAVLRATMAHNAVRAQAWLDGLDEAYPRE